MYILRLKMHVYRRALCSVILIAIKFFITITIIEIQFQCDIFDTFKNFETGRVLYFAKL